jgi:hypothetical protein
MINKVKEFLESNETELKLPFIPLEIYETLFEELGYEIEDSNTTGHEIYFSYTYSNGFENLKLKGSLYRGNFKLIKQ